jgi:hypothetical protein
MKSSQKSNMLSLQRYIKEYEIKVTNTSYANLELVLQLNLENFSIVEEDKETEKLDNPGFFARYTINKKNMDTTLALKKASLERLILIFITNIEKVLNNFPTNMKNFTKKCLILF